MRGHQQLIAMRSKGRRPSFVSIDVAKVESTWLYDKWAEQGLQAYVLVEPSDTVERLDFRPVVGMQVHLSGDISERDRVLKVFDACVAAGASHTICSLHRVVAGEHQPVELFDDKDIAWHE